MSMYNTLHTDITCPHCGQAGEIEIDLYFGDTRNLSQFRMGDLYSWLPGQPVERGGRPADGNLDGEGYAECSNCGRDFFVDVLIRKDRISGALVNLRKPGYVTQPVARAQTPEPREPAAFSWQNWQPIVEPGRKGKITPGRHWQVTPKIEDLLGKLAEVGVDIFSNSGHSDYVLLVPHGLAQEEYDTVEKRMNALGRALHARVEYRDWYPHGYKFCISPQKGSTHEPT